MDNTQCSYILKHCCCTVYYMCIVPGDTLRGERASNVISYEMGGLGFSASSSSHNICAWLGR